MTIKPLNVLLLGSGHYATGQTVLSEKTQTDKDMGVVLPSLFELRRIGVVNQIVVVARNEEKISKVREKYSASPLFKNINTDFVFVQNTTDYIAPKMIKELKVVHNLDCIVIALPDHLHMGALVASVDNNLPSLIVKPALTRLSDYYRIQEISDANYIGLVDYHKVYDDANVFIKYEYELGAYGKILNASSFMSQRADMLNVYAPWLAESPVLNVNHYLGSHYIHLVGFLTGATPKSVRATGQFGYVKEEMGIDTFDSIQTSVDWRDSDGNIFTTIHFAGWADPSSSEAMSYQEIRLTCKNGHIFSDQRNRGLQTVLRSGIPQLVNPYFFNISNSLTGALNLRGKYGFESINTFLEVVSSNNVDSLKSLPTLAESESVTAILEAADKSLNNRSCVVNIERVNGQLKLS